MGSRVVCPRDLVVYTPLHNCLSVHLLPKTVCLFDYPENCLLIYLLPELFVCSPSSMSFVCFVCAINN